MKTKAKLTLAVSALSAVVLASAVTSTFAWFTTQAKVTANTGDLIVNSPATLTIKGVVVEGGAFEDANPLANNLTSLTGLGGTLGSVSSIDGKNFYAPIGMKKTVAEYTTFDEIDAIAAGIAAETTGYNNTYTGILKYNLTVTAAKGESGKKLCVTVTANPTGTDITNSYRVAVYMTGASYTTTPTVPSAEQRHLDVGAFHAVYGSAAAAALDPAPKAYNTKTTTADQIITAVGTADTISASAFQTSVDTNVSANFVVAVWMEGNVATSQNTAGGQKVSVKVDFDLVA